MCVEFVVENCMPVYFWNFEVEKCLSILLQHVFSRIECHLCLDLYTIWGLILSHWHGLGLVGPGVDGPIECRCSWWPGHRCLHGSGCVRSQHFWRRGVWRKIFTLKSTFVPSRMHSCAPGMYELPDFSKENVDLAVQFVGSSFCPLFWIASLLTGSAWWTEQRDCGRS
jgi:hypothetical protein